jgi:hypothetical protein
VLWRLACLLVCCRLLALGGGELGKLLMQPHKIENTAHSATVQVSGLDHLMGHFIVVVDLVGKVILLGGEVPGQLPVVVAGVHQTLDHGRTQVVTGLVADVDRPALALTHGELVHLPLRRGLGRGHVLAAERTPRLDWYAALLGHG